MAQIYKLVVANGQSHRWLQLPEAERKSLWAKVNQVFEEVGGKRSLA